MSTPSLTDTQRELLQTLVQASRVSPERFMMLRTAYGVWLQHPGLAAGRLEVAFEDIDAMREAGLLRRDPQGGNYGGYHFFVTPEADRI